VVGVQAAEGKDKEQCKNAPTMVTVLLLELFLGGTGVPWIVMERWDLLGAILGIIFGGLCIMCMICGGCIVCIASENPEGGIIWANVGVTCFTIPWFLAIMSWQIWALISIANRSILCGDGCALR